VWKDIRCGELTGPRAAAAVQELGVRQGGSRQARQRFRLTIKKESRMITDRTNRKIRDQILNVSPSVCFS
jgi:hypothetical protein